MRNRAQSFMKVALPEGASLLSVEVGGAPAKPVEGKDGSRVPLLRPGFRPDGLYAVSFVYLHAGVPFAKKGDMQMTLPKMDVPVNVLEWELFIPDQYRLDRFDGNALAAELIEEVEAAASPQPQHGMMRAGPGQIVGRVVDPSGAEVPGATVIIEGGGHRQTVVTDSNGNFAASGLPSGPLTVTGQLTGFTTVRRSLIFDQRPRQVDMTLSVGGIEESVTVTAEAPVLVSPSAPKPSEARDVAQAKSAQANEPSVNVQNLQRRASGVLPVRMDVPRAGTSHRFVKPLVIDEPTLVSFRYRRR
jgi:hypothetical protein